MPTTSPVVDTRGPPELPGLSAASVWMTSSMSLPFRDRKDRPSDDTTPVVTVNSKPSGLPIATTTWPRFKSFESPSFAARAPGGSSVLMSAKSVSGIVTKHQSLSLSPICEGKPHPLCPADHMAIGEDKPIAGDDHTGADTEFFRPGRDAFDAHDARPNPIHYIRDRPRIGVQQEVICLGVRV